jgi:predicted O-methyltransferase YrrM
MTFEEAFRSVEEIGGWLTPEQARLLYDRAARLAPGARIVEIGSHHGRSTIILAKAAPKAEIVAIDPYSKGDEHREALAPEDVRMSDLARFEANLGRAGVRARVRHVHDFSTDAVRGFESEIDLLYIDGAHDLGTALADIRSWGSLVRGGGTMLIHDSFSSVGVTLAELLSLFFGGRFHYVGRSRTLAEYRREDVPASRRLPNAARQTAQLPWFARNVLVKAALVSRARPIARLLGHRDDVFPY